MLRGLALPSKPLGPIRPIPSLLLRVATSATLVSPAPVAAFDQVPRGQRAPLHQFRTLLIDRSAELVESSLPVRGRLGVAPTSTRLTTPSCSVPVVVTPVQKGLSDTLPRRRTLPTHLELHVEAHSRFAVSLLTQAVLKKYLCLLYTSLVCFGEFPSRCTAGLLLNLMLCLSLLDLVELDAPPRLWYACSKCYWAQDLKSRSGPYAVMLTLCVWSCHATSTEPIVFWTS